MKNLYKTLTALAAVAMATTFTACEPGGGDSTGTSEIEIDIPGMGEVKETFLSLSYNGGSDIEGLYSHSFQFHIYLTEGKYMSIDMTAFHSSLEFAPGRYTFPSVGDGTAMCQVTLHGAGEDIRPVEWSGPAVSGSATVVASDDEYTVTSTTRRSAWALS